MDQKKPKKYYNFSLVSYLSKWQIQDTLINRDKHIRAYAFILHDKDENKEPHYHILLRTLHNTTLTAVKKWFNGYVDCNGNVVNTFVEPMHDIVSSFEYLTHSTEQAIQDGKYQYSKDLIISNNIELWENTQELEKDNISLAVADLLGGIPLSTVALKYGRDFIIHYQSIKMLINDITKGEFFNERN